MSVLEEKILVSIINKTACFKEAALAFKLVAFSLKSLPAP
tara:strand:+ start:79 stop:198 length:120 start_codon:yes stop_codon:yes gene_type:complete